MTIGIPLFLVKNWRYVLIALFLLMMVPLVFIGGLLGQIQKEHNKTNYDYEFGQVNVSAAVMQYEPLIQKYAKLNGIEQYVPVLLAKMQQESGGRGTDVMQSSESIGLGPNTIKDPEKSIKVGVKYFAEMIKKAKGDVKLALQAYNLGGGFIPFALERGGYSKETAIEFSNMMAIRLGWRSYGDVNYVDHVLRYVNIKEPTPNNSSVSVNTSGFAKPINTKITSNFGRRFHPIEKVWKLHRGTDYSCNRQAMPISTVKGGTVVSAKYHYSWGNNVLISHKENVQTRYAHLSKMDVYPGQKVTQGQIIGNCGATGSSDGIHLHLEMTINGALVDSTKYIN